MKEPEWEALALDAACKIRGACEKKECRFLYRLAAEAPAGVPQVELGTLFGRTAYVMGAAASGPVFTIDNFKDEGAYAKNPPMVGFLKAMRFLEDVGVIVLPGCTWEVPCVIDEIGLLFIDTRHIREQLYKELDAWLPHLVVGGIVAMHDYDGIAKWDQMKPAIDERFMDKPGWEYMGKKKWLIAFRRVE